LEKTATWQALWKTPALDVASQEDIKRIFARWSLSTHLKNAPQKTPQSARLSVET